MYIYQDLFGTNTSPGHRPVLKPAPAADKRKLKAARTVSVPSSSASGTSSNPVVLTDGEEPIPKSSSCVVVTALPHPTGKTNAQQAQNVGRLLKCGECLRPMVSRNFCRPACVPILLRRAVRIESMTWLESDSSQYLVDSCLDLTSTFADSDLTLGYLTWTF